MDKLIVFSLIYIIFVFPTTAIADDYYAKAISFNRLASNSSKFEGNIEAINVTLLVFNLSAENRSKQGHLEKNYHIGMGLFNAFQIQLGRTESSGDKDLRIRTEFTLGNVNKDYVMYRDESILDFILVSLGFEHQFASNEDFAFVGIGVVLPFGELNL